MGDNIRSKPKLGYHISTKIISILLVLILTTTAFSSLTTAQGSVKDKINQALDRISGASNTDESSNGASASAPSQNTQIGNALKDLSILKREKTPTFTVVTKYNGIETTTPLRRLLPTSIDVDKDGKNDIRVWVFHLPSLDISPPAACLQTTFLVRRLNDNIKNGPFEIYLQWAPKVITHTIRLGYQTPAGSEVPKTCIVTNKIIPYLLYPKKEITFKTAINPISILGKSQLNLLFSLVDMENNTVKSEEIIQVNNSPAVRDEISFGMSKEKFIGRGQTLTISRKGSSNATIIIKDTTEDSDGIIKMQNIPKKITLSWKLSTNGHIELNTYGSGAGPVDVTANDAIALGFVPTKGVNFGLNWDINRLTLMGVKHSLKKGKSFNLSIDAKGSVLLSNLYVNMPDNIGLTASLFSLNLKGGADVGKVLFIPYPGADTVAMNVENADVVLKDCNLNLVAVEQPVKPTVSITHPTDGNTVSGVVPIAGTASASSGKEIKSVTISIDDGDPILVSGTTSWSYQWNTTSLPNGNHTITAQVIDSGSNSNKDTIAIIVNNAGHNWKPSVMITSPSNLQILSGVVHITGTANDVDGDKLTVNLTIGTKKPTVAVDASGNWYYDLDTNTITSGLYTITATGYDGKYYSDPVSVMVWVKLKCDLDFSLTQASINVTNFNLKYDSSGSVTDLGVSSFVASGSGSLKVGGDAVSIEASGSLNIQDTSISKTNETQVTITKLDKLDVNFNGQGSALISKSVFSLELDAHIYIHAAEAFGINNLTLGLDGAASAKISFDESGKILLGKDYDNVNLNIKNLTISAEGILAGADGIIFNGTGNISMADKKLTVNGWLNECVLDNLYLIADLGTIYLSGSIDFSKTGTLTLDLVKSLSFNLSYTGGSSLVITDPQMRISSGLGNVSASANNITVDTQGYVAFTYFKENAESVCCVNFSSICISAGAVLTYDDNSLTVPFDICGSGSFKFNLLADILIESGPGWIRITIGGNGNAHITGHAALSAGDRVGYLNINITLATGDDDFVIYLYNLKSKNKGFEINGAASASLDDLNLVLVNKTNDKDIINISIENLVVGFNLSACGGNGNILFNMNEGGIALGDGHVYIDIAGQFKFSLFGTVDISTFSAGVSGTIEAKFNETGLTQLNVDFNAYVNVNITNLEVSYIKYNETEKVSANISLLADQILIKGNGNINITPDRIHFKMNPSENNTPIPDESNFLLEGFHLNATISDDIGAVADINYLSMSGSFDICFENNISIIASGHVVGDNIFISAGIKIGVDYDFVSINVDSLDIYAQGTAQIILKDKNISLNAYGDQTDIVLNNASVNLIFSQMFLYLTLKELNVIYTGSAELNVNYDNSGLKAKVTLIDDDAYVKVKTFWAMLSFTYVEIRLDDLIINGDTTITLDLKNGVLVTIHTDDDITIRAFSLTISSFIPNIRLYGISNNVIAGGSSFSIGVDSLGNILLGANGSWHIDVLFAGIVIKNLDIVGELSHIIIGFNNPMTFVRLEGVAEKPTNIYLEFPAGLGWDIKLNPGTFSIIADMDYTGPLINKVPGFFFYSESYMTINISHPLLPKPYFSVKVKGLFEWSYLNTTIAGDEEPYDEVLAMDYKISGEVELANRWKINGTGYGSFSMETSGGLVDKICSLDIDCYGKSLYINWRDLVKIAINGTLHTNHQSWAFDDNTGEIQFETSQALVTINENTQQININLTDGETIVIYENGQIILNGVATMAPGQNQQVQQQVQQILDNILPDIFWLWVKRPNGEWLRLWPINPQGGPPLIKAVTTLITRKSGDVALNIGKIKILPGDKVNFTAWLNPGQESGPSDNYTFTFDFGEGNTSVVNVNKSVTPIRAQPGNESQYLIPGNYTATVNVTDGPIAVASDTTTISVAEEYLNVEATLNTFDYEEISEQTVVNGSFAVKNIADKQYSNYTLNWGMSNILPSDLNCLFEPTEGSLRPGENQTVNFSFTPPSTPGDYAFQDMVFFYDKNKPDSVNISKGISINYGLVELWPQYKTSYLIEKGSNTTLGEVFWVTSNRFETLNWEIASVSIVKGDPSTFEYGFKPSSGTLPPDNSYLGVDLWINAENEQFTGCTLNVKVQRKNDTNDSDNVTIIIKAVSPDILQNWISPDTNAEPCDWDRPDYAYDQKPVLTWSVFKEPGVNDWSEPITLIKNSAITIGGFEIRARKEAHLDQMEIKLYNGNTQVGSTMIYTDWPNRDWKVVDLGGQYSVDKVVIRFHEDAPYTGFWVHRAFVYEFYFMQDAT